MWNAFYYYNEIQQEELVFLQTPFSQNNKLPEQSIFTKPHLTFLYRAWHVGLLTWIYKNDKLSSGGRKNECNLMKGNSLPNSDFHLQKIEHFWDASYISEVQLRNQYFSYHRRNSLLLSRDAIRRPEVFIFGCMLQMYDYKPKQNSHSLFLISPVLLTLLLTSVKIWK